MTKERKRKRRKGFSPFRESNVFKQVRRCIVEAIAPATEVLRLTVDTSRGATLVALRCDQTGDAFIVNETVGDAWAWDARFVTNVTRRKKNSDQPFECNQFCTGN